MPSTQPQPSPPEDAPLRVVDILPGASVLVLCAVGLFGALATKAAWTSPDKPWHDGQWGVAYEDALDEELFVHDLGVETWGVVEWALFETGRPGVEVGDDGWLFTSEEFATYAGADENVARNARLVGAVKDAMAAKGVRLVVAMVPAKARVMSERLGRYRVPAGVAAWPATFGGDLRGQGVAVLELEAALTAGKADGDVFLRTDTHWTPHGAAVAAKAIAATLRAESPPPAWLDSARVTLTTAAPVAHPGDLLRYVPLGPLQARLGPKEDTLATPTATVESSAGLLDEVTIPVALVGTSYSDDARWGFVGALQKELGADVLNAAAQGQGPFVSMMKYLDDEAWSKSPPQLVIWEIPERYLGKRDDLSAYTFGRDFEAR